MRHAKAGFQLSLEDCRAIARKLVERLKARGVVELYRRVARPFG